MKKRLTLILASLFAFVGMALAQTTANGVVVSASDGEPVIGASVRVKDSTIGTVTDLSGNFSLEVPNKNSLLEISYIGMVTKTFKVGKGLRVTLENDDNVIDEVMVVAYGTTKRSAFTGSAGEIKADEISAHLTSNAVNALNGKVAGLSITSTSGAPGSTPNIVIRGVGSINASSNPLYIVDGAPYESGIDAINPNDIESISVLKDASAAAIYGARGANGVIIVTTKRAKDGDAKITFDAKFGTNSREVSRYDLITNPAEYYETQYKAMFNSQYYHGATAADAYAFADANLLNRNNGGLGVQVYTIPEGEKMIGTNFKLNPNATLGYCDGEYTYLPDNWYDTINKSSNRQEYNTSVAGSSGRINYYASVGYLNDGGIVKNSRYQRYTGRANVDYQVKKWLKVVSQMGFAHINSQTPSYSSSSWGSSGNVFYVANQMGAIYPLYVRDAQGNIMTDNGRTVYDIMTNTNQARASIVGNAVRDNDYNRKQLYNDIFTGNWAAIITPIEGLTLKADIAVNSDNNRYNALYSVFGSSSTTDGEAYVYNNRYYTVNQTYTANYAKTIEKHNFDVLLGYEQFNYMLQYLSGENTNLYDPYIGELDNAYGFNLKSASSSTDKKMNEGFFGRAQYDFDSKYFASVSYRRDASSIFAPGHRWGNFGSVGLAWQMNKEKFMENLTWVDLLKLKASYGVQGNDNLPGYYVYADQYKITPIMDSANNVTGYSTSMYSKGNENITWETNKAWNFGVDFSLFNYRLNGSIDFFSRTTSDLLYWLQVPASSGLTVSGYYANVGEMRNRGIELTLDGVIIKNKNVKWDANINLTHYRNKILDLDHTIKGSFNILEVGGSVYDAYLYKYAGVDSETGEAQYYKHVMYDADGNVTKDEDACVKSEDLITKSADEATKYNCGTTLPTVQGGFGTSVSAYGFDFSAQFSFQLGGKIYDGFYQAAMHNGQSAGEAMHKDLLNAWSETNKGSNIPRLSTASADDGLMVGTQAGLDFFNTSSNYLSLNNVTLGYTLPKAICKKFTADNLRIYVAGENLFLLSARQGLDPRYTRGTGGMTSGAGYASGSYAAMRALTAGISVTF